MLVTTKYNQTTISKKVTLSGVGLHTGKDVSITFCPADADQGPRTNRVGKRINCETTRGSKKQESPNRDRPAQGSQWHRAATHLRRMP